MLQHSDIPFSDVKQWETRRNITIRLIYYEGAIRSRFSEHYKVQIKMGYAAIEKPSPKYATLSRKQALVEIQNFENSAKSKKSQAEVKELSKLLTQGLRDLESAIVPTNWI